MIDGEELKNTNDSELIMLYRENDEDAKNLLFYKYKYIIDILINKYNRYFVNLKVDNEEIYSECTVSFSNALKNYSEYKDASLVTFVTICVERKLKEILRKYNRDKYKYMTEAYSLDFIYEENTKLMDKISDDSKHDPLKNIEEEENIIELIKDINERLSKFESEVFTLMVSGFNSHEIVEILKSTPKKIDNTMQRIKYKAKKILEEMN